MLLFRERASQSLTALTGLLTYFLCFSAVFSPDRELVRRHGDGDDLGGRDRGHGHDGRCRGDEDVPLTLAHLLALTI